MTPCRPAMGMLLLCAARALAADATAVTIPAISGTLTIDGKPEEPAWQGARVLPLASTEFGAPFVAGGETRVAIRGAYLCLSAKIPEPDRVVALLRRADWWPKRQKEHHGTRDSGRKRQQPPPPQIAQGKREIGIRMALGAPPVEVARLLAARPMLVATMVIDRPQSVLDGPDYFLWTFSRPHVQDKGLDSLLFAKPELVHGGWDHLA